MSFNKIKYSIEHAPMTFLPALLMAAVNACKKARVFRDDEAMLKFVKNVQKGSKESEDVVEP